MILTVRILNFERSKRTSVPIIDDFEALAQQPPRALAALRKLLEEGPE
jgi:hypothetical protein